MDLENWEDKYGFYLGLSLVGRAIRIYAMNRPDHTPNSLDPPHFPHCKEGVVVVAPKQSLLTLRAVLEGGRRE